ncbi:YihY/virulence factor BrkB family protein [Pyrinomonas sp.]|uniref:YihY/virulence factor BrkB family protein n=1 Tax=Pyrinomonas sp. TaxID=2080306 RepID=UPI00333124E9
MLRRLKEIIKLDWRQVAKRTLNRVWEEDIFGHAAQLSYYFLLSLFPLLLFLTTLLGYFAETGSELRRTLFIYLAKVLPTSAYDLIHRTVDEINRGAGGGKLSFGILATLWAASSGMGAISNTLNVAYGVKETRPWWRVRLTAILLTIGLAVFIISALAIILFGGTIGRFIADQLGLGAVFAVLWRALQIPLVIFFLLFAFALIYYFAPNLQRPKWQWITPGSIVGVALWLLVSFGLRAYLQYFNSYNRTYGTLGAVIILMLWFYLTGAAILIGGEINSEAEKLAAQKGMAEPPGTVEQDERATQGATA